jgi:hypothetical protein
MEFDPEAAMVSLNRFAREFEGMKEKYPEAMAELKTAWDSAYMACGHKALGKVVLGKSVDQVTLRWADRKVAK